MSGAPAPGRLAALAPRPLVPWLLAAVAALVAAGGSGRAGNAAEQPLPRRDQAGQGRGPGGGRATARDGRPTPAEEQDGTPKALREAREAAREANRQLARLRWALAVK